MNRALVIGCTGAEVELTKQIHKVAALGTEILCDTMHITNPIIRRQIYVILMTKVMKNEHIDLAVLEKEFTK